jgi:hypothetical protein
MAKQKVKTNPIENAALYRPVERKLLTKIPVIYKGLQNLLDNSLKNTKTLKDYRANLVSSLEKAQERYFEPLMESGRENPTDSTVYYSYIDGGGLREILPDSNIVIGIMSIGTANFDTATKVKNVVKVTREIILEQTKTTRHLPTLNLGIFITDNTRGYMSMMSRADESLEALLGMYHFLAIVDRSKNAQEALTRALNFGLSSLKFLNEKVLKNLDPHSRLNQFTLCDSYEEALDALITYVKNVREFDPVKKIRLPQE